MYISFNSPRFYSWENRPLGRWDVCRSQLEFRSTQLKHWGAKSLSLGHSRGGSTASAVPEPLVLSSRQPGHPPGTPLTRACGHTLLAQVGAGGRSWRLGPRKERRCPWLACPLLCLSSCPWSPPEPGPQPPRRPPPQPLHSRWYRSSFLRNHWPDQREWWLQVHWSISSRPLDAKSEALTSILYVTRMSLTMMLSLN